MDLDKNLLKPDLIIEIIIKRRWFILIPVFLSLIIGISMAIMLPKVYESNTLILVQPQKVPSGYVKSIVSSDANARISAIIQQIMSRKNLENILSTFRLFYGEEYKDMYLEDKLNNLRERIKVKVTKGRSINADAFSISFTGKDPRKVMQVVNALAAFVIDENLKVREAQAIGTSKFLDEELRIMRSKLEEHETNLMEYREKYMGGLPVQLDSNLRILDRLQEQLSSRQAGLREAKVRLATLDKLMAENRNLRQRTLSGSNEIMDGSTDAMTQEEELQFTLESLKSKYTEKHPDVVRIKKRLKKLRESSVENKPETATNNSNEDQPLNRSYSQIQLIQREEIQDEIKTYMVDIDNLMDQMRIYQKRVEDTPKREQELLSIQRDYQNIKNTYESLLARKTEAQLAVNMEKKQKGEQFYVLDSAKLPQKPVKPSLKKILIFCVGGATGLGAGMIFLIEFLNTSFRRPEEIEDFLGLPVVTVIPKVLNKKEIFKNRVNLIVTGIFIFVTAGFLGFYLLMTVKGVGPSLNFFKSFLAL